jgi:hypothetical protein
MTNNTVVLILDPNFGERLRSLDLTIPVWVVGSDNHLIFSFLTTDASHDVAPTHSDATPVCLFTEEDRET